MCALEKGPLLFLQNIHHAYETMPTICFSVYKLDSRIASAKTTEKISSDLVNYCILICLTPVYSLANADIPYSAYSLNSISSSSLLSITALLSLHFFLY